MRKYKTKKRVQKGGLFEGVGSFFSGTTEKAEQGLGSMASGITSYTSGWGAKTKSLFSNPFASSSNTSIPEPTSTSSVEPTTTAQPIASEVPMSIESPTSVGGRRRKRKSMRGGKGGLGLVYYATPVSDIKVAEPTYWIKGGSRRRKTRRHRRKTRRSKK